MSESATETRWLGGARRPLIAVCGPDAGGTATWLFTARAVRRAGGRPVRVTPRRTGPLSEFHGLILGGGADVGDDDPLPPGAWRPPVSEEPTVPMSFRARFRRLLGYLIAPIVFLARRAFGVRDAWAVDAARDRLEHQMLASAVQARLPVLGICRGAQLINVFFGGTLHRDLSSFYAESANPWTVFPRKPVRIETNTRLHETLGREQCPVNSLHRNAIAELGAGLTVSAREPNGVVQAIERYDHPYLLGVQWHPEYLPQRIEQRRLFEWLISEACRCRDRRAPSTASTHHNGNVSETSPRPSRGTGAEVRLNHVAAEHEP